MSQAVAVKAGKWPDGTICGCLAYHVVPDLDFRDLGGWEGWERGGCNWQACECACHSPDPCDEDGRLYYDQPRPVGHDACCQGNCGGRVRCWGCKEPVLLRIAERIATYGVGGSTEYWHSWCWGKALEEHPEWSENTYHECWTCGGDGMLDDVMPCGDCENGRADY